MRVEKEKMEKILAQIPPAPDDVLEWIQQDCVQKSYILYSEKERKAVCTRCGNTFDIDKGMYAGKAGYSDTCYCCYEAYGMLKPIGRSRGNLSEYFRVLILVNDGPTIWGTLWRIEANFEEAGQPAIYRKLTTIYRLNSEVQERYELKETWSDCYWEMYSNVIVKSSCNSWWLGSKYDRLFVYTNNLEEVFKTSDARYLWDPVGDCMIDEWNIVDYLGQALKYKSLELLYKSGFKAIALGRAVGNKSNAIYWRGRTLEKILRLPRADIRRIRKRNPTAEQVRVYQRLTPEERRTIPWEAVKDIASDHYWFDKTYRERICECGGDFIKTLKYLDGQEGTEFGNKRRDWLDYIKQAKELGMDIYRNSVRYPENLQEAHDAVMAEWTDKKNEINDRKIRERIVVKEFHKDGLKIIPADSQRMLNEESAQLCHCVKTYGSKLAEGKCMIFFIRREEEPDKSYYTLETTVEGKKVQCRGLKNCSTNEEVDRFVDAFLKHLDKAIKEKEKLCKAS